jgi:hypothetical protein
MSALSIRLSKSLHERVRELAAREGISINQLIATALAEKLSALMTADYLEARAKRGSRARFLDALDNVPDTEPDARDTSNDRASNRRTAAGPSRRRPSRRPRGRARE